MESTDITTTRRVIGSFDQPAWVLDGLGRIITINQPALRTLGYRSDDDVLGTCSHSLFHHSHPDGEHYDVGMCPVIGHPRPGGGKGSEWFIRRTGVALPISWSRSPLQLDADEMMLITMRVLDRLDAGELAPRESARERESRLERCAIYGAACDLIMTRVADPALTPSAVARDLHVSLRYLQTAFADADDAPARRIRVVRVNRAADLIQSGVTVADAMAQTGFTDATTFRRAFRRHVGSSPSEIRAEGMP